MPRLLVIAIAYFLSGCGSQPERPIVLTDADRLDAHVGEVVTIRGEVINSKIPTIIGVDVRSHEPDLRGQEAEATGVLERWVVTPEQIAAADYANRGPGVFYRLRDENSNYDAGVRPVSP